MVFQPRFPLVITMECHNMSDKTHDILVCEHEMLHVKRFLDKIPDGIVDSFKDYFFAARYLSYLSNEGELCQWANGSYQMPCRWPLLRHAQIRVV